MMFMFMAVIMLVGFRRSSILVLWMIMTTIFRIPLWHIVMVKVEEALHKKHGQKTAQQPGDHAINRMELVIRIGQEMQQGDTEHEARHETNRDLQARMRRPDDQKKPAARQ